MSVTMVHFACFVSEMLSIIVIFMPLSTSRRDC